MRRRKVDLRCSWMMGRDYEVTLMKATEDFVIERKTKR